MTYENEKQNKTQNKREVQYIMIIRRCFLMSNFNQLLKYINRDLTGWLINYLSVCVFSSDLWFLKKCFSPFILRIPGKLTYIWWTYGLLLIDLIQKRTQGKALSTICLRALGNVYFRVKSVSAIPSEQCNWNRLGSTRTRPEASLV